MKNINGYQLSRDWFDFCFENPERIKPNHTALYFFCIEHCNRLGWKDKFGLPTTMAKEAIGIHSYNTFIQTLNDLIEFGFIKLIEKSTNQYSSNIIALSKFNKAHNKALDKASIKHMTKHSESTVQSKCSINKQITNKPINNEQEEKEKELNLPFFSEKFIETWNKLKNTKKWKNKSKDSLQMSLNKLSKFDEDFSIELMENAIEGEYQGVVFPNTKEFYKKWKEEKNGTSRKGDTAGDERKQQLLEEADEISRRGKTD